MSTASSPQPRPCPRLDTSSPNIARVYDYWLGGKDNFPADREEAERLMALRPTLRQTVQGNRRFLARAVTWLAQQGVRQFLDVGSGLPTVRNTHEVVREVEPSSRVVYVDKDPVVVGHATALLADAGVGAVEADLADPAGLLAHPGVRRLIGPDEPTGLILTLVLHFFDPEEAAGLAAEYAARLAPGSYAVISVGAGEAENAGVITRAYRAGNLRYYSLEQTAALFAGTELVPPGVTDAQLWFPGPPANGSPELGGARILAGVGRKPA